jgi:hypothetical protein
MGIYLQKHISKVFDLLKYMENVWFAAGNGLEDVQLAV